MMGDVHAPEWVLSNKSGDNGQLPNNINVNDSTST